MDKEFKWDSSLGKKVFKNLVELAVVGDHSESQMAEILSNKFDLEITRNMVHGQLYRQNISSGLENHEKSVPMPYFTKYEDIIRGSVIRKKNEFELDGKSLKILTLNDIHFPFANEDALERALVENMAADVVVMSEIADMYSQASWIKERNIPLEREIEEILRFFEYMNKEFPVTIILTGNHELRVMRKVAKTVTPDLLFLMDLHILKVLARPFPNIHVTENWFYQINDTIFCHQDRSSKIPMRVSTRLVDTLTRWSTTLELEPFKCLVQAHTHKAGVVYYGDVKVIETGALCELMDWAKRKLSSTPWTTGWAVIHQKDGVTDWNKSREYIYR